MADISDLAQALAFLQALRTGGAESTISTADAISVKNRFTLTVYQSAGIALSFVGAVAGLGLMTWSVDWLLELEWEPRFYILAWSSLFVAAYVIATVVRAKLASQTRAIQSFAATVAVLVLGLFVGSLLVTVKERFGWQLGGLVVGAGMVLGSLAMFYNMAMEVLTGSYWRRSPFEEAVSDKVLPVFERLLEYTMMGEASSPDVRVEDPRYLVRKARNGTMVQTQALQGNEWEEGDWEDGAELVTIEPEVGNLVWFVRFAATRPSLSLSDLTVRPAPVLPFRENGEDLRLRRTMIRRLLVRGSTEDVVTVEGMQERGLGDGGFWQLRGRGSDPAWVMDRSQAQREAIRMWRAVYEDQVPPPDVWGDVAAARVRAA